MRFGILGLHHDHVWGVLDHLEQHPEAELVAAADPYPELRDRFAGDYGKPVHEDYFAVLEDDSLDALGIFASNRSSAELTVEGARRGRHVLLEKPMAADAAGAGAMHEAALEHEVRVMVNWPFAWWPALQHAIDLAKAGEVGRLWEVKYRGGHRGPGEEGCSPFFCEWLFDPERNGAGAFLDYCCYGSVLSATLLGEPEGVFTMGATLCKPDFPVEDNAFTLLRYPNAMACLEASWTQQDQATAYVAAIYGESGTLIMEGHGQRLRKATPEAPQGIDLTPPSLPAHLADPVSHFLHAVRTGEPFTPLCAPDTGLLAQRILEAGKRSMETRREAGM